MQEENAIRWQMVRPSNFFMLLKSVYHPQTDRQLTFEIELPADLVKVLENLDKVK